MIGKAFRNARGSAEMEKDGDHQQFWVPGWNCFFFS